jgi:hypothetical protein
MYKGQAWFDRLNPVQQELIKEGFYLLNWAKKNKTKLYDYSFIVMPAAKAYEGFLKDWLFKIGLINKDDLEDDKFRIGKALNPHLERIPYLRKECLYQEISQKIGQETAEVLWQTWRQSRNRIFHYFHHLQQVFTLDQAEEKLNQIVVAIKATSKNS